MNTAWNYVNEISARSAEHSMIWATKTQLRDLTKGSGKLLGLLSQVVQEVIDEFLTKRIATRRPKLHWHASHGPKRALGGMPVTNQDIALDGATVLLRGQRFRLWLHRAIEGRIKLGNFGQDARSRWYRNLVCEMPRSQDGPGRQPPRRARKWRIYAGFRNAGGGRATEAIGRRAASRKT